MNLNWACCTLFVTSALLAQVADAPPASPPKSTLMSGSGGFPLTASVTSLWGAVDEVASEGKKTLSFMIYYRGAEGWHKRKWSMSSDWYGHPFFAEFKSDVATLRAEVDRSGRILKVLDQSIDLSKANVVFVDHVDQPGSEVVTVLGHINLSVPADANPALWVLQQNESIRTSVLGADK